MGSYSRELGWPLCHSSAALITFLRSKSLRETFVRLCRTARKNAGFCCQVPADPAYRPARSGGLEFPVLAPHYAARATGA